MAVGGRWVASGDRVELTLDRRAEGGCAHSKKGM